MTALVNMMFLKNMKASQSRKEPVWLALVFLVTLISALYYFHHQSEKGINPFFYQSTFEPAVMVACGRDFAIEKVDEVGGKVEKNQPLSKFLSLESKRFSCADLPEKQNLIYQFPAKSWYYMMATVGYMWKLVGVSWDAVDKMVAVFFALSACLAYGLIRLGANQEISAVMAVGFTLSHIKYITNFRDYSKAPFFLGGLLLLAILVKYPLARQTKLVVAIALGALVGVGYGFRPDLLILLPFSMIVILLLQPEGIKQQSVFHVSMALLLVLTFYLVAYPIIENNKLMGSCTWHFPLLGLADDYTERLKLAVPLYSWIYKFNDMLAYAMTDAFGERVLGLPPVGYCTPLYDQVSRHLYTEIALTFPADFISRFLSSIDLVLLGRQSWGISYFIISLALMELWHTSRRAGVFFLMAIIYFCGYPFLQFHERHYFYARVFLWGSVALATTFIIRVAKHRKEGKYILQPDVANKTKELLVVVLLLVGMFALVKQLAIGVQERKLSALTTKLDKLARDHVAVVARQEGRNLIVDLASFPHGYRQGGAISELAVIKMDSIKCKDQVSTFRVQYVTNNAAAADFSEDVRFRVESGEKYRDVYLPLYYVDFSAKTKAHPQSIIFSEESQDCFIGLDRITDRLSIPLWIQISVLNHAHSDGLKQ